MRIVESRLGAATTEREPPAEAGPDPAADRFPRVHSLLFAGGLLGASFFLYLYSMAIYAGDFTILTGGYCLVTMVAVLLPMLVLRDESLASPITMLAICVFVSMPVRFAYLVEANHGNGSLWQPLKVGQADYMQAAAITAFAFCLFAIVYIFSRALLNNLPSPVMREGPPAVPRRIVSLPRFAVFAVLGLLVSAVFAVLYLKAVGFSLGDINTLSRKRGGALDADDAGLVFFALSGIMDVPRLLLVVSITSLAVTGRGKLIHLSLIMPLLFFAVLWPFLTSVRQEIIFMLISLFLAYYIVYKRIPIVASGVAGCFGLLMFGLMTALRNRDLRDSVGQLSFMHVAIDAIGGSFNLGGFVALAHALVVIPARLPLEYGQTFLSFLWLMIPRALWPDKPLAIGYIWLNAFGGDASTRAGGGAATGLIAEGYLNFALAGSILVMGVYAVFIALYYHFFFLRRRPSEFSNVLYLVCLPAFTMSMYGYFFSKGFLDLAKMGVALALIFGLLFVRDRTAASSTRLPAAAAKTAAAKRSDMPKTPWQRRLARAAGRPAAATGAAR